MNMLFNNVLGENEKCAFYFYFKNRRNLSANPILDYMEPTMRLRDRKDEISVGQS